VVNRKVDVSSSGRAGSVYYREGDNTAEFYWEFAASPALAIVCGANAQVWDQRYPWAAGRQAEIFDFVAEDVVRQQASGYGFEVDLYTGTITVMPRTYRQRSPAENLFRESMVREVTQPSQGGSYDLVAIADMNNRERKDLVGSLTAAE
jgi:hypothetical protein